MRRSPLTPLVVSLPAPAVWGSNHEPQRSSFRQAQDERCTKPSYASQQCGSAVLRIQSEVVGASFFPMRTHPHLYEINTWPWLESLSRRVGRRLTLEGVPGEAWSRLRDRGVDVVYLMGVWRRSALGRQFARGEPSLFPAYDEATPGWRARDIVGSAFCITAYEPDDRMGGWAGLDAARAALHARGMRLIVDFIPNHVGFDHPWIGDHPDWFVAADEEVFRQSPAAFRPIELRNGDVRFIACGRDPFFPAWTDVAQLNHFNMQMRAALVDEVRQVARHADGVRCDMAMLVLSDVFERTWGAMHAGQRPAVEFWADVFAAVPDRLFVAEAYWDLEWQLQQLGFDFTYDKRLYDRLLRGSADDVRAHLRAEPGYQRKSARFIENHDEPRSAAAFGARVDVASVVTSTLPGLRFFYDGQFDGRRIHAPVQLGVVADEATDERQDAWYRRLLAIVDAPVFHAGEWRLCDVAGGDTARDLVAWRWRDGDAWRLVVVNLGSRAAEGRVDVSAELPLNDVVVFEDLLHAARYEWARADLTGGLYVRLEPGAAHVLSVA